MLLQYSPSALPSFPQQAIVWILNSILDYLVETFPRPRGKTVTQLPRIFFFPFSLFFLSQSYLSFYLGESFLIIKTAQWKAPLNMMTDVSLCSSSPIRKIINGNPFIAKTSLCCSEILPWFFFPFCCTCECGQISCWVPLATSSSSSKGKGVQNPKCIWLEEPFEKEAVGPVSLAQARNAETLYFKCGP